MVFPTQGRFWVCLEDRWGIVDLEERWVLDPIFEDCSPSGPGGWDAVQKDGEWYYIRPDGSRLWDRTFLKADCYDSGIALVKDEQGTRYIDLWGDTVYSCGQADAQPFSEGLFLVEKEDGWRFLNLDGSDALGRSFEEVVPFEGGLAWTREHDLCGLVDVFGNMVLPYQFEYLQIPYKYLGWIIAYRSEEDFEVFTPDGRPAEIDWG